MDESGDLIRRWCRSADERAFRAFYRRHAEPLWRFACARGCDPDSAYDVVADSFERFVARICRNPRQPVAFLYRIAINRMTDLARRRAVREPAPPADPDMLAAAGNAAEAGADLDQLFGKLAHDEQNLLLLRYWVGLTHREVADVLAQPEGTVRRRAADLLARIRARDDA